MKRRTKASTSKAFKEKEKNALTTLYSKLGLACDAIIAFLLSLPFDLDGFEYAMKDLGRQAILSNASKASRMFTSAI